VYPGVAVALLARIEDKMGDKAMKIRPFVIFVSLYLSLVSFSSVRINRAKPMRSTS
jgi:hypothetical protein